MKAQNSPHSFHNISNKHIFAFTAGPETIPVETGEIEAKPKAGPERVEDTKASKEELKARKDKLKKDSKDFGNLLKNLEKGSPGIKDISKFFRDKSPKHQLFEYAEPLDALMRIGEKLSKYPARYTDNELVVLFHELNNQEGVTCIISKDKTDHLNAKLTITANGEVTTKTADLSNTAGRNDFLKLVNQYAPLDGSKLVAAKKEPRERFVAAKETPKAPITNPYEGIYRFNNAESSPNEKVLNEVTYLSKDNRIAPTLLALSQQKLVRGVRFYDQDQNNHPQSIILLLNNNMTASIDKNGVYFSTTQDNPIQLTFEENGKERSVQIAGRKSQRPAELVSYQGFYNILKNLSATVLQGAQIAASPKP